MLQAYSNLISLLLICPQARDIAEKAIAESKALRRLAPKKAPIKRSILKEIGNLKKPSSVLNDECGKSPKKKRSAKKAPQLIQGQTKLTAFFKKS